MYAAAALATLLAMQAVQEAEAGATLLAEPTIELIEPEAALQDTLFAPMPIVFGMAFLVVLSLMLRKFISLGSYTDDKQLQGLPTTVKKTNKSSTVSSSSRVQKKPKTTKSSPKRRAPVVQVVSKQDIPSAAETQVRVVQEQEQVPVHVPAPAPTPTPTPTPAPVSVSVAEPIKVVEAMPVAAPVSVPVPALEEEEPKQQETPKPESQAQHESVEPVVTVCVAPEPTPEPAPIVIPFDDDVPPPTFEEQRLLEELGWDANEFEEVAPLTEDEIRAFFQQHK
jgi:hypothetical protein